MFRTWQNYLGMAPRSAQVGDQVWILPGTSVPFILQPLNNGNFQLVGEAYVHGIVHGEAVELREGEFDMRDVVLE